MQQKNIVVNGVLESCCLEWYQNISCREIAGAWVLESCCLEWYQNS
ncbi:hypothetical protein YM116_2245 [Enterococcus faecalis]|nr:hypothetical protein YM116_2245 [Enterococcus faecalis]